MKSRVGNLLQFSVLFSLCGNAGSQLHEQERLRANGHLKKALKPPIGGFSLPADKSIHYSILDSKMHDSVEVLRIMFDQVATMFYEAEVLEGSNLLNCYSKVNSVTSVSDLDINAMLLTLNGAKRSFKKVEDNIIALQGEVHLLIETVRHRIRELRNEIQENEAQCQIIDQQIKSLEEKIRDNEDKSRDYDREARNMEKHAYRMEREAESASGWGFLQLAGAAAIGYFTGGVGYLVAPGVLLGGLGVKNVVSSGDYRSQAKYFKENANRYTDKA